MIGQIVYKQDSKELESGYYEFNWLPNSISSGIYLFNVNMEAVESNNRFSKTIKMVYLK